MGDDLILPKSETAYKSRYSVVNGQSRTFGPALLLLTGLIFLATVLTQSPLASYVPVLWLIACFVPPFLAFSGAERLDGRISIQHLAPAVFPGAYIAVILVIPFVYMLAMNAPIGSISSNILSHENAAISIFTVCGFYFGICLANAMSTKRSSTDIENHTPLNQSLENALNQASVMSGRYMFLGGFGAKVYLVWSSGSVFTSNYGANQLDFGPLSSLTVMSDLLLLAASVLLFSANTKLRGFPAGRMDGLIFAISLLPSLIFLGSRGEVIGPIVVFLWYAAKSKRGPKLSQILIASALVAILFVGVGVLRSGGHSDEGIAETVVFNLSSPVFINSILLEVVPDYSPYYGGGTYLAAVAGLIPGPIRRAIGAVVDGSGALAFRDLIGFDNPNMGYGFSFPSEAYMNFGAAGVLVVSASLGALFQAAYQRQSGHGVLWSSLYPLLLGYLPYGFRSDALGQLKTIVYTLAIILVIQWLARVLVLSKSKSRRTDGRHVRVKRTSA